MTLNLAEIRRTGKRPRVHGNGFIQIDLSERERLHVWGDERIPRQAVSTPIHDHVFSFRSRILVGRLLNVFYDVEVCQYGDYHIYVPEIRVSEDTILQPSGMPSVIVTARTPILIAENTRTREYFMPAFEFHETFVSEPSATLIEKRGPTLAQGAAAKPRVLVPVGEVPDNEFNRYDADEDLLWRIVEDTMRRMI